jgi:hypothetical protein
VLQTADLLAKSAENKALNNKKRLATSRYGRMGSGRSRAGRAGALRWWRIYCAAEIVVLWNSVA